MKTPLVLLLAGLLAGCQAFPTLTHPRTGFNYDWTPVIPYTPPAYYGYGYYPEPAGISRNDFIIAMEGE